MELLLLAGAVTWLLLLATYFITNAVRIAAEYVELRAKEFRFEQEMQQKLDAEEDGFGQAGPIPSYNPDDDSKWGLS